MKKLLSIATALTVALTLFMTSDLNAQTYNDPNLELKSLWKDFDAAVSKDLPKKEDAILDQIIKESLDKYPWDYYRASEIKCNLRRQRNWKDRSAAEEEFKSSVEKYGLPVMMFYYLNEHSGSDAAFSYAKEHSTELRKSDVKAFREWWASSDFQNLVISYVRNDYEYALWVCSLYQNRGREELKKVLGSRYPEAAILDYVSVADHYDADRRKSLEEGAARYNGKAAALLFRQDVLLDERNELDSDNGTSEQYKALYDKCKAFEKERKSFSGDEKNVAACADRVEGLIEQFESKDARVTVNASVMTVLFRNLDKLKIDITTGDKKQSLYKTTVNNSVKSFYVYDTVKVNLPNLSDGNYFVNYSGTDVEESVGYEKTSLSIAYRTDSKGIAVYPANYKTGEPVRKADLVLKVKDKETVVVKDVQFDGFTRLPQEIVSKIPSKGRYEILCRYTESNGMLRTSDDVSIYVGEDTVSGVRRDTELIPCVTMLLDRKAFKPGETVNFKAILYSGTENDYKVFSAGKKIVAVLRDPQYNEVARRSLTTNEFGSVAGSFDLVGESRNGMFSIDVQDASGRNLSRESFRVDEYVLPTFEVRFEESDCVYLEGDRVVVKGKVTSYSGHSVSSAKVYASAGRRWGDDEETKLVDVKTDGSFEIVAENVEAGYYVVKVKVVDATGETLEFNTSFNVYDNVPLHVELLNEASASCGGVVADDVVKLSVSSYGKRGNNGEIKVIYRVLKDKKTVSLGSAQVGEELDIDLSGQPSGTYVVEVEATAKKADGSVVSNKAEMTVYKVSDSDKVFNSEMETCLRYIEDGNVTVQFMAGMGDVWACVEIFSNDGALLRAEMVHLDGKRGGEGSVKMLSYAFQSTWGDSATLKVFYFRNGTSHSYEHTYTRKSIADSSIPLSISRFYDTTAPATKYVIGLRTVADAEAAVSIFDKSTETIMANRWADRLYWPHSSVPYIHYSSRCGTDGTRPYFLYAKNARVRGLASTKAMANMSADFVEEEAMVFMEDAVESVEVVGYGAVAKDEENVTVREDFASTIAFLPFLRSDRNGDIEFEFRTSDQLSTYVMNVFAHDKTAHAAMVRKEFFVTIPVKLSVVEPQVLTVGDKYVLKVNLTNGSEKDIEGRVAAYFYTTDQYKTASPVASESAVVSVKSGAAQDAAFEVDVPNSDVLGIKVVFTGKDGETTVSDAVFVKVPVRKATQTIREAHSSIFLDGQDRDALISELRSRFVNIPGSEAEFSEITIMDMIRKAVPERVTARHDDLASLLDALYASVLCGSEIIDGGSVTEAEAALSAKSLVEKLMACHNDDGGFGWFEGMDSSPVLTVMLLTRAAAIAERGLDMGIDEDVLADAVKYIDGVMFKDSKRPIWCGGLSLQQYVYVRSMYADVELAARPSSDFKKALKEYLVPKKAVGMNGQILNKARRLRTLMNLSASDEGVAFAKALGVRLAAPKKLAKSIANDKASLLEYAVEHKSGGVYYPNAVLPFRGLLESELYAHSVLCDLFRDLGEETVADGIRLWIMVQKETQQWDTDPAYLDALASVSDGSDALKRTSVLILSATREIPVSDVKAAGNGFKVSVSYVREDGTELKEGDRLAVGDKIKSVCKIWNEENRSFVHLVVPRPANLRAVDQKSGYTGMWLRTLSVGGYNFAPSGYRNVHGGETEYFYDVYPEEDTTITEELYVTQAGEFSAPVATIESLYAPHYVANDGAGSRVVSE